MRFVLRDKSGHTIRRVPLLLLCALEVLITPPSEDVEPHNQPAACGHDDIFLPYLRNRKEPAHERRYSSNPASYVASP